MQKEMVDFQPLNYSVLLRNSDVVICGLITDKKEFRREETPFHFYYHDETAGK